MSEQVLTNKLILFGGLNISGNLNQVRLALGSEPQDFTTFADDTRTRLGGLKDVAMSAAGFFDAANPDSPLFTACGAGASLITLADSPSLAARAFFFRALVGQYSPIEGGEIGAPHRFALEAGCYAGDLFRGTLMENSSFTATGNGTGSQLGAVSATQSIRLALHVLSVTGDWDVVVESDDNASFTTATTRITEAAITAAGGFFQALAGAITDDYWRLRFVENSAGTIELAAALSIQ